MTNDFVNTITTKDGTTYDIQDKRLNVTSEDVGKVVSVDESGNLVLIDMPSKDKHFYCHNILYKATYGPYGEEKTAFIYLTMHNTWMYPITDMFTLNDFMYDGKSLVKFLTITITDSDYSSTPIIYGNLDSDSFLITLLYDGSILERVSGWHFNTLEISDSVYEIL